MRFTPFTAVQLLLFLAGLVLITVQVFQLPDFPMEKFSSELRYVFVLFVVTLGAEQLSLVARDVHRIRDESWDNRRSISEIHTHIRRVADVFEQSEDEDEADEEEEEEDEAELDDEEDSESASTPGGIHIHVTNFMPGSCPPPAEASTAAAQTTNEPDQAFR